MAHVVIVTYGITSYLNASYAVAAELRARGHRVTYVSSLDLNTKVTKQGFEFVLLTKKHSVRQDPERLQLEQLPAWRRYRERSALIRVGRRQKAYYLEHNEWVPLIQNLHPDVLLIDEEVPEAIIRSTALKVPVLLLQYLVGTRWQSNHPPPSSRLLPDGSMQSRVQIILEWLALWLKRGLIHLLAPLYYAGTDRRSILRALAVQSGFDYRKAKFHHWFPITFPDITTLFFAAPEFDFSPPTKVDGVFVGPMVWPGRVDPIDDVTKTALDAFLEQNASRQRPLIYCSLGTFWQIDRSYLQRVVMAFRQRPEWDLALAGGTGTNLETFEPLPDNVFAGEHLPQLQVLKQAKVVLTHGGIGTINECITYGVPMIVYSTGYLDQNGNAARVEYHGLGLRGQIDAVPATIAKQISQVMTEPRFKTNVEQMQTIYRRYQANNRAVELIERLLMEN